MVERHGLGFRVADRVRVSATGSEYEFADALATCGYEEGLCVCSPHGKVVVTELDRNLGLIWVKPYGFWRKVTHWIWFYLWGRRLNA